MSVRQVICAEDLSVSITSGTPPSACELSAICSGECRGSFYARHTDGSHRLAERNTAIQFEMRTFVIHTASQRFIAGLPIKLATNRLAGFS